MYKNKSCEKIQLQNLSFQLLSCTGSVYGSIYADKTQESCKKYGRG
ncbi:MAG: hypothetical protein Ta2B_11410 [Termitinemataceae bacterium]|nr:MAG: hypothetical protein Ta2B_11410 [Termitinemataceae bacterium]